MRIAIEYQYSDRNYTRFVTYAGATHQNAKWSFEEVILKMKMTSKPALTAKPTKRTSTILVMPETTKIDDPICPDSYSDKVY
jgi:hypothetical protein